MRDQADWDDVKTHLKEVAEEGQAGILGEFLENPDLFIRETMTLTQAAYREGYEDALADLDDKFRDLEHELHKLLPYTHGL